MVPTVVAASRDITLPQVDVVANDDWVGTELAVEHLLGLGHTRIAHLAGSLGAVADLRRRSYLDTMHRHGLDASRVIETSDMTEEGGYRAAVRLLGRPNRPTAIFAVNDITCVGAMSAAQELGLRVPADVSLVGYDNTSLAQIRHLWLTSVDNASTEVGQLAARALLRRIADPTRRGHRTAAPAEPEDPRLHRPTHPLTPPDPRDLARPPDPALINSPCAAESSPSGDSGTRVN